MNVRINVTLTEEDLNELARLIEYSLKQLILIVEKHKEVTGVRDINVWRAFLDELLMNYVSGLLKMHIQILQNATNELARNICEESKESGII
jgi:hypothetical protein